LTFPITAKKSRVKTYIIFNFIKTSEKSKKISSTKKGAGIIPKYSDTKEKFYVGYLIAEKAKRSIVFLRQHYLDQVLRDILRRVHI